MKKILLILLIGALSFPALFAEETEFEFDISNYTDVTTGEIDFTAAMNDIDENDIEPTVLIPVILDGDAIDNINFGEILPELNDKDKEELTTILKDEGYEDETITATLNTVDKLSAGETLGSIKENDPETFAIVENAIIDSVARQVSDTLIPPDVRETLDESLELAESALNVLQGFAQSTANSAVASSMFGYQGYKLFNISLGLLGSTAIPNPYNTANTIIDIQDSNGDILTEMQDLKLTAGVSLQGFSLNVGLNLGWLVDNLYVSVLAGSTYTEVSSVTGINTKLLGIDVYNNDEGIDLDEDLPTIDMTMDTGVFGVKANYQLVKPLRIPILFRWNGISVGTGFIRTYSDIKTKLDLSPALELEAGLVGANFNILSEAYTIPLEVSTGVQLLSILTITTGAAVDIQFGNSLVEMDLTTDDNMGGKIIRELLDQLLGDNLSFPYHNDSGTAKLFNPRVNLGVGVGLGPLTLDTSVFYYFRTGIALGANLVLRW